jgi:hypothetical protein
VSASVPFNFALTVVLIFRSPAPRLSTFFRMVQRLSTFEKKENPPLCV